jgi:hypothetical protein
MFESQRVETRTAEGRVEASGVTWTERREGLHAVARVVILSSFIVGFFILFLGTPMAKDWWKPVAMGLALIAPFLWIEKLPIEGTLRQLLFYRDGSIEATFGLAFYPRHTSVSGHHADLVSIEARSVATRQQAQHTNHTHGVILFKRNGDMTYVAKHLHPDEAHKVAVQMMLALTQMRDDMASDARQGATRQQAPRVSRFKAEANALIE